MWNPGDRRWSQLGLLAIVELLAMSLWFSATAVAPAISATWGLSENAATWLTNSVQIGFVVGALISAVFNLADRFTAPRLITLCALAGAAFNLAIALGVSDGLGRTSAGFGFVLALRFLTGAMLAGVYPPGMKLMASWFVRDRGLAIGCLVGALTIGTASPHLIHALPLDVWSVASAQTVASWRLVMTFASVCAAAAAVVCLLGARPGPHLPAASHFEWGYFARVWLQPALRRANFGYLGHMFELYAMWAWAPRLLLASYEHAGWSAASARVAGFATVAVGSIGCFVAGLMADRAGRCWTTIASLVISGGCALVAGSLFNYPALLTAVCVVWGLSVIADSAQFSAAVSELCDPRHVGTALTIQTCVGFLLTTLTIRAVPAVTQSFAVPADGWPWATAMLAAGPVFGIFHMLRLRGMEDAKRMASGNR